MLVNYMEILENASPQVLYWVPISDKSTLSFRNVRYLGYIHNLVSFVAAP